ncbi:MAG: hypothetical protein QXN16_00555 [Candidatus Micrarchaeaceae archaeon]
MITRSRGKETRYFGLRAGAGYEGKTKELDDAVVEEARFLEEQFNGDIEIRFNTDQKSGGAFLKDGIRNDSLGLGAMLEYRYPNGITSEEQYLAEKKLSEKSEWWKIEMALAALPKDRIQYDVTVASYLLKPNATFKGSTFKRRYKIKWAKYKTDDWYLEFPTLKSAEEWIQKNVDYEKVKSYVRNRLKRLRA